MEETYPTFVEAVRDGRIRLPRNAPSDKTVFDDLNLVWTTPDTSIRSRVNVEMFTQALIQCDYHAYVLLDTEEDGTVNCAHVLTEVCVPGRLLEGLLERVNNLENLSDEAYEEARDEAVQELWAAMSSDERLDLVIEGNDPIESALEEDVPEGAELLLYRGIY